MGTIQVNKVIWNRIIKQQYLIAVLYTYTSCSAPGGFISDGYSWYHLGLGVSINIRLLLPGHLNRSNHLLARYPAPAKFGLSFYQLQLYGIKFTSKQEQSNEWWGFKTTYFNVNLTVYHDQLLLMYSRYPFSQ